MLIEIDRSRQPNRIDGSLSAMVLDFFQHEHYLNSTNAAALSLCSNLVLACMLLSNSPEEVCSKRGSAFQIFDPRFWISIENRKSKMLEMVRRCELYGQHKR